MYLFFDTETTGLFDFSARTEDPKQPRLVELAAQLTNSQGDVQTEYRSIIRPDGWTIPDDAAKLHGITTERALEEGRPLEEVIETFAEMAAAGIMNHVAHNYKFDEKVIRREVGKERANEILKPALLHCTMMQFRPICQLEKNKLPKLSEAYKHCFGKPHEKQHTALGDVNAVREIFFFAKYKKAA